MYRKIIFRCDRDDQDFFLEIAMGIVVLYCGCETFDGPLRECGIRSALGGQGALWSLIHWLRVTPGMNIGLLQYRRKIS